MEYNALKVSTEIWSRIDGAGGPGGYLKAYVSSKLDELFFSDHVYLITYVALYESNKVLAPGGSYYKKLETFIKHHCERGKKYMEFVIFVYNLLKIIHHVTTALRISW